MTTFNGLIRHTFLWLAAVAVPIQGLPSVSCGCASARAGQSQIEASGGNDCCSDTAELVENSCCAARSSKSDVDGCCCCRNGNRSSTCQCGDDCRCGKSTDPKPAVPPAPNTNTTQKITSIVLVTSAVGLYVTPPGREDDQGSLTHIICVPAAQKCVHLCRFTL